MSDIDKKEIIEMVVRPHHMTYPRSGHKPGEFAIVVFNVVSVTVGKLPSVFPIDFDMKQVQITGKGKMPDIGYDRDYVIKALYKEYPVYGPGFEIISMRLNCDMTNREDIEKFFSFFMTKGRIGLLYAAYDHPEELLKNRDYKSLMKIKGIKEATAVKLCDRYAECVDNGEAYVALSKYGLTKNAIDGLVRWYGSPQVAIDVIEKNPYALLRVWGYGWERADAVARQSGFAVDSPERVVAYAQYFLEQQKDGVGDSWILVQDWFNEISAACDLPDQSKIATMLLPQTASKAEFEKVYAETDPAKRMMREGDFKPFYYDEDTQRIGLLRERMMEKEIARHLERIKGGKPCVAYKQEECLPFIKKAEKEQGFEYTNEQVNAIWSILSNPISVLTGRAGTGKSTVLNAVVKIMEHYKIGVEQCALSGRASSNLTEITGLVGKTIHRLLGFVPESDRFAHTEKHPLPQGMFVVDEASMIGGDLFLSLLQAIPTGSSVVLVGDLAQLDPIGGSAVFKDCISSRYIPTCELRELHRQAKRSGIVTASIQVSMGNPLVKNDFSGTEVRGELKDFKIVGEVDRSLIFSDVLDEYKGLLQSGINAHDVQVLTPLRSRGVLSCVTLNQALQQIANEGSMFNGLKVHYTDNKTEYDIVYRVGDRVIVTKNNYSAIGVDGEKCAVFNGNIGYIKAISGTIMTVSFLEQGDVVYKDKDFEGLQLAYAATVHKFQGTGIPYVIFALDSGSFKLFSRQLVYTALTRAKKYCCVIADPRALNTATRINVVADKKTWLIDDLRALHVAEVKKSLAL
jgi:exodeoxyribonuclease V alpha subunit